MKFSDFLKLNEEDGGLASGGDTSVNTSTNIDGVDAQIGTTLRRINMPQITKELMGDFISDLKSNKISFKSNIFKRYNELLILDLLFYFNKN